MPDSSPAPSASYLTAYADAIARHGAGFDATLWGSTRTQELRFAVINSLLPLAGRSVVDIGCGQGDLAAWMARSSIDYTAYQGLDAMEPMVEKARSRNLPRASFAASDLLKDPGPIAAAQADVAVFSGTLNTMNDEQARRLITPAWESSRIGVVFNFLSDRPGEEWLDRDLTPARRFATLEWMDWALSLSPCVRFDQSYLGGHDATIAIVRPAAEPVSHAAS